MIINSNHFLQACGILPPRLPTATHSVHNEVQRTSADRMTPTTQLCPTLLPQPTCNSPVIHDDESGGGQHVVYAVAGASAKTISVRNDVHRMPADRMTPTTTRLCPTMTALPPQPTGKSPVITDEESGVVSVVYTVAGPSANTKVISVADHPSQSASVEVGNLAEECNVDESDYDNESFISGSTQLSQKKTTTTYSLQAPNSTKRKPSLENSLEFGATATSLPFHGQKLKSLSHSPLHPQESSTVAIPHSEGMVYNCDIRPKFKAQSTPTKAVSAVGKQVSPTAVTQTPAPPQYDCTEPKALLECNSCPPMPCAVIDPLDSNSRELVEMVCFTVNSKWPILARYFCLSEEGIASIKEQDCEAEGRCWVLLRRLYTEGITWKELHDMLLNKVGEVWHSQCNITSLTYSLNL